MAKNQTIDAVTQRINAMTDEPEVKLSYEQVKHVLSSLALDEDLRITFSVMILRGRAAREEHTAMMGSKGKDEKH